MNKSIKILLVGMAMIGLMAGLVPMAAAQGTILPLALKDNCVNSINSFNKAISDNSQAAADKKTPLTGVNDALGCAIVTGRISLPMIPYFIQYFSNYLLGMVSLVALLFVVIGGVMYSVGEAVEKKGKGLAFIKNALIGMVVAFLVWSIVSVILAAITG